MSQRLRAGLAALADEVRPVDLRARVVRRARRRIRRAWLAAALSALLVGGGTLAAAAALRPDPVPVPPLPPTGSPSPSAEPSPTPNGQRIDILNVTLDVPPFPDGTGQCPGGIMSFVDGVADGLVLRQAMVKEWIVWADLDGEPGDEVVVDLTCALEGRQPSLPLIVKIGPGGTPMTLGWAGLSAQGTGLWVVPLPRVVNDATLWLYVTGPLAPEPTGVDLQQRGYAVRDGRVVQVSGVTTFPTAVTDPSLFDPRNATVTLDLTEQPAPGPPTRYGYSGTVKIVGGTGQAPFTHTRPGEPDRAVLTTVTVEGVAEVFVDDLRCRVAVVRVAPAGQVQPFQTVVVFDRPQRLYLPSRVLVTAANQVVTGIVADGPDRLRLDLVVDGTPATRYSDHQYGAWSQPA